MARKRISPNAIVELKAALTAAFWYRRDLLRYATAAVNGEPMFLAGIDWLAGNKRDSVDLFVDRLHRAEDEHPELLLDLLVEVSRMDEFPFLSRHEDAAEKIAEARAAVARLRKWVAPYEQELLKEEQARERRTIARRLAEQQRATTAHLAELKARFYELVGLTPQERGRRVEHLLYDLLDAFDLEPTRPYAIRGEQIDGGFRLDGTYFLLESKWENEPTGRDDIDIFDRKVGRKAENTLGLFFSMQGFYDSAIELNSTCGSPLILADYSDLLAVLEERITLPDLLRAKHRHASRTGRIFLRFAELPAVVAA